MMTKDTCSRSLPSQWKIDQHCFLRLFKDITTKVLVLEILKVYSSQLNLNKEEEEIFEQIIFIKCVIFLKDKIYQSSNRCHLN